MTQLLLLMFSFGASGTNRTIYFATNSVHVSEDNDLNPDTNKKYI